MTTARGLDPVTAEARHVSLVWIDAAEAVIVRLRGDEARLEHIESDVPAHHKSTGHVRHDTAVRHGGGGRPQTAGEPHRLEHLKRFVGEIANRLVPDDDLLILGPGTVHERLGQLLVDSDANSRRHRSIACEASPRMTDRQLVARLRAFAGFESRRHTVGSYRWSSPVGHRQAGHAVHPPRRVVSKPPRDAGRDSPGD